MFGLFKKKDAEKENTVDHNETEKSAEEITAAEQKVRDSLQPRTAPERDTFVPPSSMSHGPHGMTPGGPSGIPGFDYSPVDPNEEFKATGGKPLEAGVAPASEEAIVAALQTVYDPEIPVNIYDLGLIYGLDIDDKGFIKIDMTLTAPGCPVAGEMPGMVARAVEDVDGAGEIEVTLVWEPQWTPERMSEDAKLALGMGF
ncbi:SUF system Fe-S cluster assembly protein [Thalassospiraceae bacterium LMO-JJ14]|nr:SUF system Fe-S cluster assembly protein [Thalassospiraceae bacterium LMO-JJ14]